MGSGRGSKPFISEFSKESSQIFASENRLGQCQFLFRSGRTPWPDVRPMRLSRSRHLHGSTRVRSWRNDQAREPTYVVCGGGLEYCFLVRRDDELTCMERP